MNQDEFEDMHFPDEESVVPERVRRSAKIVMRFGYGLPLVIYVATVLFAPLDVLDQFPWMKAAADAIHGWLLSKWSAIDIYRHARSTVFPQVAMLCSALGVCTACFVALATIIQSNLFFKDVCAVYAARPARTAKDRIALLVVLPLMSLFTIWVIYCIKGDPSFAAGLTTKGRLGYAFITTAAVAFTGAAVGL